MNMKRLHELDYLRGFAAAGIMLFHYLSWTFGEFSASQVVGRVGIYGVSIFYILSGLTLYHVYNEPLSRGFHEIGLFFKRRVLRIFPLLWITTIASIFIFDGGEANAQEVFLNLTGLFGFIDWPNGIAIGSWSIGNELVFYVFFPVFVFLYHRSKAGLWIFSAGSFLLFVYFAYFLVDIQSSLSEEDQRSYYCNPLNQLFLFLGGYLVGVVLEHRHFKLRTSLFLIAAGTALFILWPESGDRVRLIGGHSRMVLSLSCFLICIGFYKFTYNLPTLLSWPLRTLGEISYSVYMLHPIIHRIILYPIDYVRAHFFAVPESVRFLLAIILTLLTSYFVYHTFEKFFIRLGKKPAVRSV
jgi:exopolysaccharide production protein ExoZ